MPLGKLSKKHIQKGYEVLTAIDGVLKMDAGPKKQAQLLEFTNKFYTLIPHDFGTKQVPLIDNSEELQKKMKLMEALIDIEIATTLLKETDSAGDSPIDANYKKLKTELVPVDQDDDEYEWITKYMTNQKGVFDVSITDIFKVKREGESERLRSDLNNHQLLWHGSRVTN